MFKIGDFSKISGVSIRTLRYYDEIDLFKPSDIDMFTDYRYYDESQLDDIKLIRELKNVGFSLEEIKRYWGKFSNEIMLKKRDELFQQINEINNSIKKLDLLRSKIVNGNIVLRTTNKVNSDNQNKVKILVER